MEVLNLTNLLLIVFVICSVVVLLRGALRILSGCLVIALSGWVALRVWVFCPEWANRFFGGGAPWLSLFLPVLAFIVALLLGRAVARWLTTPFRKVESTAPRPLTLGRLVWAAVLSLIPTCLLGSLVAVLILHVGEIEEMKNNSAGSAPKLTSELMIQWRKSVLAWVPISWLKWFDPGFDPSRLKLAKEIQRRSQQKFPPVIDPNTGKPYPRAIIVEDPGLQDLAREGSFSSLLRHPLVTHTLNDPTVKSFLNALKP